MQTAIAIENLNVGYTRDRLVLDRLNLEVPQAAIYGFLGANGAGKSTTIRTILGLLRPHSGSVQVFGKDLKTHRLEVLSKVGTLIESPSLYKHLSGYDNLKIACKYLNLPTSRIDEVLRLVNLYQHRSQISKKYSTGMKQRLGLAIALLTDPELLILDEPTSGLDPTGIIEIRTILQQLNERGKTIFLSSHLLSEIEKIATQVGILKNGTMIFQGTVEELDRLKMSNLTVNIVTSEASKVAGLLGGRYRVKLTTAESLELLLDDREKLPAITQELTSQGIKLYEVSLQKNDLEKLFINLTEN
jgi:lantibiotic transport system ATP-binding protein